MDDATIRELWKMRIEFGFQEGETYEEFYKRIKMSSHGGKIKTSGEIICYKCKHFNSEQDYNYCNKTGQKVPVLVFDKKDCKDWSQK